MSNEPRPDPCDTYEYWIDCPTCSCHETTADTGRTSYGHPNRLREGLDQLLADIESVGYANRVAQRFAAEAQSVDMSITVDDLDPPTLRRRAVLEIDCPDVSCGTCGACRIYKGEL